jgi:hypothetical protein
VERVIATDSSVFYCLLLDQPIQQYFKDFVFDRYEGTNKDTSSDHSQVDIPFGKWFAHFFPELKVSSVQQQVQEVPFSHISQHDLVYWEALLALSHSSNPEDGHFLERSWLAVFHPLPRECIVPYEYMDIVLPEKLVGRVVVVVGEEQKSAAVRFFEWWAQFFARIIVLRVFLLLLALPTGYLLRCINKTNKPNVELCTKSWIVERICYF